MNHISLVTISLKLSLGTVYHKLPECKRPKTPCQLYFLFFSCNKEATPNGSYDNFLARKTFRIYIKYTVVS